jgi:serine protease
VATLVATALALSPAAVLLAHGIEAPAGAAISPSLAVMPTLTEVRDHRASNDSATRPQGATTTPQATPQATSSPPVLDYHGGSTVRSVMGPGVLTGSPRVYLIFWGSQWGTPTVSGGITRFSSASDPQQVAPVLQHFFEGLGTGADSWSSVMSQYCEGGSFDASTCAGIAYRAASPTASVLAGVWVDSQGSVDGSSTTGAAPPSATEGQLAGIAYRAALHFGNSTSAKNASTEYVVVSPTGTNPDNWEGIGLPHGSGGFCAWHDFVGDPSLSSQTLDGSETSAGLVSFTNLPYIPDAKTGCGAYFVHSNGTGNAPVAGNANPQTNGTDDGVSIVEGHEYAESLTDPVPVQSWPLVGSSYVFSASGSTGGWYTDVASTLVPGQSPTQDPGSEAADLCAWLEPGTPGGASSIALATGSFPVQAIWSNLDQTCMTSELTVTAPAIVSEASHAILEAAHVSSSSKLSGITFSATGLPAGLSIVPATGVISGTASVPGRTTATIEATSAQGVTGVDRIAVTIEQAPTITSGSSATFARGVQSSVSMSATGFPTPSFSVVGSLPPGVSLTSTGHLSGVPTAPGVYSFSVKASNAAGSVTKAYTLTVTAQLVRDPGIEASTAWTTTQGVVAALSPTGKVPAYQGTHVLLFDGVALKTGSSKSTGTATQSIAIPTLPGSSRSLTLSFWAHVSTTEVGSSALDTLAVSLGTTLLTPLSNLDAHPGYQLFTLTVPSDDAGKTVSLHFAGTQTGKAGATQFYVDVVQLLVS